MARVLLKQPKILVMDEATASLDYAADEMIKQLTVREFRNVSHPATILAIAHRLDTILDSDRIMVFEAGQLVEFDTPARLLRNPNGFLTKLVASESRKV
jgi:ABC-type multidrug transport system fused ATPase/permease subunit